MCNFSEKQHIVIYKFISLKNNGGFLQIDSFPMQSKTINFKLPAPLFLPGF